MDTLVSVPVVTYNSASFVEETLESVYNQSHQNIQLIISDDCSKDNTISLVESWCNQPRVKNRFADITIITVPKNTGVSANCNRSIEASKAKWIKFIAGDDILLPDCLSDNLKFIENNPTAQVIFSQVKVFHNTFRTEDYLDTIPSIYPNNIMKESFTAEDQFRILIDSDRITYSPGSIFQKKALVEVGRFDETNKLVEDYPMWLRLTRAGTKLFYFHTPTVGYRIHANATNNKGDTNLFKPSVINGYLVRKKYAHPYLSWLSVKSEQHVYFISLFYRYLGLNKKSSFNKMTYQFTTIYCNPFIYLNFVKKIFKK